MDLLPNELIIVIFNFIKLITDKRQFLKTCIHYNNLTKQAMLNYEHNYNIPHFIYENNYCVEKFTLELCHDGYFNLIPDHYINKYNYIITRCSAYFNNVSLLELAKSKDCCLSRIFGVGALEYGALAGHISVLDWCVKNNFDKDVLCSFSIQYGHLHVLKWLQEHGFEFNRTKPWLCNNAADNGQLEILKFAREIGCPWNIHTYRYALKSGNEELIKYLVDNGCPTN